MHLRLLMYTTSIMDNCQFNIGITLLLIALSTNYRLLRTVKAQENAGLHVASSLFECYNNTLMTTREYRLPSTLNVFIELIRTIEDNSNYYANTRELGVQILQRFCQSGILKVDNTAYIKYGIPYSPSGPEAYKNRVLLQTLLPGSAVTFNNDSLNALQRCSLHSLISSTIETNPRGDESTVCNQYSRYTRRFFKRELNDLREHLKHPNVLKTSPLGTPTSACPIESGVFQSNFGTVKAGLVLAGIVAGFQPMNISAPNGHMVNNIYAATLSGELAEVSLYQNTEKRKIGIKGGWNSTIVPRYYFLQDNDSLQVTDAEIRGSLDGLYLGLHIQIWKSVFSNLKISQILEMYYSERGVFSKQLKACNRYSLISSILSTDELIRQTTNFNYMLDSEANYPFTIDKQFFPNLTEPSVNSFNDYIGTMNDPQCHYEDSQHLMQRGAVELLVFLDASWYYKTAHNLLSYILEHVDYNKFGTTCTIHDGVSENVILNKSHTILDFYEKYNYTEHLTHMRGFDYNKVFQTIQNHYMGKLDNTSDLYTAQSTIVLLMIRDLPNDNQKSFLYDKKELFRLYLPDLKIIAIGSAAAKESYRDLVFNVNTDVFILFDNMDETNLKNFASSVINRIKQIPKNVVNPRCGSKYTNQNVDSFSTTHFVEPQGINYYKIAPNYFFNGNDKKLQIWDFNMHGQVSVCISRTDVNPRGNVSGIECQIGITNEISYNLNDFCDGQIVSTCQPIYLSIEGISSRNRCTEKKCRFPDNIKYQITLQNVGCAGGTVHIVGNFITTVIGSVLINTFKLY